MTGSRTGRYKSVTINVTPDQYTQLRRQAEAQTTSISQLLRVWVAEYLTPPKKKEPSR